MSCTSFGAIAISFSTGSCGQQSKILIDFTAVVNDVSNILTQTIQSGKNSGYVTQIQQVKSDIPCNITQSLKLNVLNKSSISNQVIDQLTTTIKNDLTNSINNTMKQTQDLLSPTGPGQQALTNLNTLLASYITNNVTTESIQSIVNNIVTSQTQIVDIEAGSPQEDVILQKYNTTGQQCVITQDDVTTIQSLDILTNLAQNLINDQEIQVGN